MTEVLGVVLAGGRSRRFGSDKFLHRYDGVEMGLRALRALEPIVDDLVVVGRERIDDSWPGRSHFGVREGSGPFGALVDVFEGLPSKFVVSLPCDMPLFAVEHCESLLDTIRRSDADVCVACSDRSTPQWLAAAWNVDAVRDTSVTAFEAGERSVERFVTTCTSEVLTFDPDVLLNLNEAHRT